MLVLTRKLGESIIIDENIQISVVEINKNNIKLGVKAPKKITIYRQEVLLKIKEENELSSSSEMVDFLNFPHVNMEK
ncbi:carbon storage regulator [Candidatus Scalindua japonica]|uniref:Translational regulator CsrA n=1 Tax=Candidatus Scalindua japonica TaxID=1284222 RepID=A0A286TVB7_9BACT|nr:carbon storage regulator CsrA [Candidatus Scalindua japonica]GAX59816.1 carbon storage regulator [Candidatus Scalindua japonica]